MWLLAVFAPVEHRTETQSRGPVELAEEPCF